jgi:hypothetical protein
MTLTVETLEDGRISIPYTRKRERQTFSDAIVLDPDDYQAMTEEQIVAMMDQRFDNWYNFIVYGPPPVVEEVISVDDQVTANTEPTIEG